MGLFFFFFLPEVFMPSKDSGYLKGSGRITAR